MALNKAYSQYMQNSIYTATPEELTMMLYNGLIRFLLQAQLGITEKNIEKAYNSIIRAQDIILYFRNTLDMKYEISENLDLLYEYMNRRLMEANMKKDQEIITEVLGMAKELRDTWSQAMKQAKHPKKAMPQTEQQEEAVTGVK